MIEPPTLAINPLVPAPIHPSISDDRLRSDPFTVVVPFGTNISSESLVRLCLNSDMPRYFFNIVRNRTVIDDPEGDVLSGDAEARLHAATTARAMFAERHKYRQSGRHLAQWAFKITDESGRHVATVLFSDALQANKTMDD
jgi:uncharacterized protein DUF6894